MPGQHTPKSKILVLVPLLHCRLCLGGCRWIIEGMSLSLLVGAVCQILVLHHFLPLPLHAARPNSTVS